MRSSVLTSRTGAWRLMFPVLLCGLLSPGAARAAGASLPEQGAGAAGIGGAATARPDLIESVY
jgi:hypothetical protein